MNSNIITPLEDSWREAVANPKADHWYSIATAAAAMADCFESSDPDNIMAASHRGVYEEAYKRYLAMMPKEKAA